MTVHRADNLAVTNHPFRQRPLTVRTAVLDRKQAAVALPEHGDLVGSNDVATPLALWNSAHHAQPDV
jgi:hypothetical protein